MYVCFLARPESFSFSAINILFVAKRKTNQLEKFKKEESAGTQKNL